MSGTKAGAQKTKNKLLALYPNYYAAIGRIGGSRKVPKGFATMPHAKVMAAAAKGGSVPKNRKK